MIKQCTVIRLVADYYFKGVYSGDSDHIMLDELPLSEELKKEIYEWQSFYSRNSSCLVFDVEPFNIQGFELAKKMKNELGKGYTVQYFDEILLEYLNV